MASNVINQWFINYKSWIILEAITLAILYAFTHQGPFACSCSELSGRTSQFHTRKQSNHFPMRINNARLIEKAISFE